MPLDQTNNADQYANPIPAAIRRQGELADQIARDAGVANVPPADAPATDPAAAAPAADVVPVPTAAPTPTPTPTEDWEQRYRTLQGKYDSEVPGLRTQINSLERVIAAVAPPAPAPTPVPAADTTVVIPPKDVEDFGEDLVAASRRWARAEVEPVLAELRGMIAELKGKYGSLEQSQQATVKQTSQNTVLTGLDADPDIGSTWRATNDSPAFVEWLNHPDPFSGQIRFNLLGEAYTTGQTARVKAFFTAYSREHTVTQVPTPAPTHTPTPGTGSPTLEDLAAPGRVNGQGPTGAPADKRMWTQPQIAAFYRDVSRGAFEANPAEKARLEQDIFAAAAEGRIR